MPRTIGNILTRMKETYVFLQTEDTTPLEGGAAGTEAGAPATKTEEHPKETTAAPVEKSEPETQELPPMEGEPTPAEEKEATSASLENASKGKSSSCDFQMGFLEALRASYGNHVGLTKHLKPIKYMHMHLDCAGSKFAMPLVHDYPQMDHLPILSTAA